MSVFAVTREGSGLGWDATRRKRNYRIRGVSALSIYSNLSFSRGRNRDLEKLRGRLMEQKKYWSQEIRVQVPPVTVNDVCDLALISTFPL